MKNILKILVAVVCCAAMAVLFNSCNKEENTNGNFLDTVPPDLIGTWTEKNTLFTDVLTIRDNGEFTFKSHLDFCNGSGNYKFQRTTSGTTDFNFTNSSSHKNLDILILYYSGKSSQTMKIINLTNKKLEMSDQFDNLYHFTK